eukprot:380193-Pyramimonas_sp.AAC.1
MGREGGISVLWTPSHLDPSEPSLSEDQVILASGSDVADELAGQAAQESWDLATRGQRVPDTGRWDATCFLIRQRAAQ